MEQPPIERPDDRRDARPGPTWTLIALPAAWLVFGVLGGVGIIKVVQSDDAPAAQTSSKGPAATTKKTVKPQASAKPKPKAKPRPEPSTEPTTEATTEAPATRSLSVSVYNQVGIGGLAGRVAGQLRGLGWTVGTVADWRGGVPQDTVYYPAGGQAEAALLAQDLGIARLMPAIANMSTSALTVVLASPR
ncbi:hypothetical protein AFL01nite_09820 [Aeromicrobium flavum]|uniref:LytR/CpsA/Psr regulator C-terminal domain-containing protein n=1 Tax=Aeromicrobium flavum TaxID=416568 RepID=A0A512HTB7_9ACTN|nr:LytR C-terminal domain-containing protein [Aeromicrobium flavum]GEO88655.1 hypothetical protein AFL01nite_09820 [Aeromicrobium flavum]